MFDDDIVEVMSIIIVIDVLTTIPPMSRIASNWVPAKLLINVTKCSAKSKVWFSVATQAQALFFIVKTA